MQQLRHELGLSVKGMCSMIGISDATYYRWDANGIPLWGQIILEIISTKPGIVFEASRRINKRNSADN